MRHGDGAVPVSLHPHPLRGPFAAALVALAVLAAAPGAATAEYGGRSFFVERPQLGLGFSYRFESEARDGPYGTSRNRTHAVTERADLQTSGWGYHPAFATYTLALSPEWEQAIEAPDSGERRRNDSFLLGYSLETSFLPYKPVTLNAVARRQRTVLTGDLATRSETRSDTYGATLLLKNRMLPTTVAYTRVTLDQTGFFDSREVRDEARLQARHDAKRSDTNLDAAYKAVDRTSRGVTIGTNDFSGGARNHWRVTADRRVLLNSGLAYRRSESGAFRSSGVSLSESLSWTHARNISSSYQLSYTGDSSGDARTETTSASAGITHLLYENLTSSASVRGSRSSQGQDVYGGNLGFGYQRPIPKGSVFACMAHDYTVTRRSAGGELLPVSGESLVLRDGDVTLLSQRNVTLSSIVITSADRSVVYLLDTDYRVEPIGPSVRIVRTPFGAIADGQTVLANYTFLSRTAYDDAVYSQSYGAGLFLWSAWRISYRYGRSRQMFLSGAPPDERSESTTQGVDSDLKIRWSTTRFLWEDTEGTTGVSLTRWRVSEDLAFRPAPRVSFSVSGQYGETTLKDTHTEETFSGFGSQLQWMWSRWSRLRLEGNYSRTDGASNRTVDKAASARLEWFYGIWSGEVTYRFLNEEDRIIGQSRDRHSAWVSVRRALY